MKFFIASIGSGGDLYPMLSIGAELARRGHDVTVLAGDWQEAAVRRAGLAFHGVLSEEQFNGIGEISRAAPTPGGSWVAYYYRAVMPAIGPVYDYVSEHQVPGQTFLIAPLQAIGLRLAAERYDLPLVTILIQPRSLEWGRARAEDSEAFNRLFGPVLDRYRRRYGLAPITQPFDEWAAVATDCIGLFPEWFVAPEVDAPDQGEMVDFILSDADAEPPSNPHLDAFLARYERPIVFTYGTGNDSIEQLFAIAHAACTMRERPAIFLTAHGSKLPQPLPPYILHLDYFPLQHLLPYVGAIAYHGGIGTCAQAIRAGIPQLVVPMGFDQFTNAARLRLLGIGASLSPLDLTARSLDAKLEQLLEDAPMAARCRELAARFSGRDGAAACSDVIEARCAPAAKAACTR